MTTLPRPALLTVLKMVFQRASLPMTLFVWASSCIACTIAGPFGTYEAMGVAARAAYWTSLISMGVIIGFVSFGVCVWYLGREKTPVFPVLAATFVTLIFGPLAIALRAGFAAQIEPLQVYPVSMAINIFLVTAAIFAFRQFLPGDSYDKLFPPLAEDDPAPVMREAIVPRLLRRLPDALKAPVISLSANDHHVEVVTEAGRHVLRMRLVDAIDEMEPIEGMCVHRSHWVVMSAIAQVERINAHKTQVHLVNGDCLPVSRKYKPNLDEAGLTETSIAAS